MKNTSYIMSGNTTEREEVRLAALAAILDPNTIGVLERLGIQPGWKCLEVGSGLSSMAAWLAARVGPSGHVVALDIDERFLGRVQAPNLSWRHQDITVAAVEPDHYDLIHVRYVLAHLPQRQAVLHRLCSALRPGGWLVAEEPGCREVVDPGDPIGALRRRLHQTEADFARELGADLQFGAELPRAMAALGLAERRSQGWAPFLCGGTDESEFWYGVFIKLRETWAGRGLASEEDIQTYLQRLRDPEYEYWFPVTVSSWGRRSNP